MSFRMRVLALVAVVAAIAVAVTAWITYVQANREVTRQVAADERTSGEVWRELVAHANAHAGWDGVAAAADALADRTGQRIRLVADDGGVLVDTGLGPGGATPPVTVPPIVVDARPTLDLPPAADDLDAIARSGSVAATPRRPTASRPGAGTTVTLHLPAGGGPPSP